eukprot:NODE_1028_length_2540_cov_0.124539.p3 type:complete len:103 gc:universal NODE_1028_length_2540_cov_0.124539:2029-1721(-)
MKINLISLNHNCTENRYWTTNKIDGFLVKYILKFLEIYPLPFVLLHIQNHPKWHYSSHLQRCFLALCLDVLFVNSRDSGVRLIFDIPFSRQYWCLVPDVAKD